jgi:transposase
MVMFRSPRKERASKTEVTIIGIDLAKRVFQVHGAAADGSAVFRRKLSRARLLPFLAQQPACTVAMEARRRPA